MKWQLVFRMILFVMILSLPLSESSAEQDACLTIREEIETKGLNGFEGAERRLGMLCGYGTVKCDGLVPGPQISLDEITRRGLNLKDLGFGWLLDEGFTIRVAEIDINNDGVQDLWLSRTVGTAVCQENHFFIRDSKGSYVHKDFLEDFGTTSMEGKFCGGEYLTAQRVNGLTYLVLASEHNTVVFLPRPSGGLTQVCEFKPEMRWTSSQKEVVEMLQRAYPNLPVKGWNQLVFERPQLETLQSDFEHDDHRPFARKGEKVWEVVVKCKGFFKPYGAFLVHPVSKEILPLSGYRWDCW